MRYRASFFRRWAVSLPMGKLIPRYGAWLSQEQGRRFVPAVT